MLSGTKISEFVWVEMFLNFKKRKSLYFFYIKVKREIKKKAVEVTKKTSSNKFSPETFQSLWIALQKVKKPFIADLLVKHKHVTFLQPCPNRGSCDTPR